MGGYCLMWYLNLILVLFESRSISILEFAQTNTPGFRNKLRIPHKLKSIYKQSLQAIQYLLKFIPINFQGINNLVHYPYGNRINVRLNCDGA